MSRLNVANFRHPDGTDDNITFDSSTNATVAGNLTASGNLTVNGTGNQSIAGTLQFNSGYGSVATAYGVRAWINFDGTSGSIGTGDANGNISGVTDLGTGDYTIAIDNDMPDANYVIAGHVNAHQAWGGMVLNARADGSVGTKTVGSFSLATIDGDSARDYTDVGVLVIR